MPVVRWIVRTPFYKEVNGTIRDLSVFRKMKCDNWDALGRKMKYRDRSINGCYTRPLDELEAKQRIQQVEDNEEDRAHTQWLSGKPESLIEPGSFRELNSRSAGSEPRHHEVAGRSESVQTFQGYYSTPGIHKVHLPTSWANSSDSGRSIAILGFPISSSMHGTFKAGKNLRGTDDLPDISVIFS
ncbi:hypothetical protein NMY22_g3213 [Coprinellus aureogranulatus]|nr:hypothetical protein NMY22_g3213 [Coprinellus aureogranulatus]